MKVLYDYQIFDSQKIGGISRYFFELMTEFEKENNIEWDLPIHYSNNEYLKTLPRFINVQPKVYPQSFQDFLFGLNIPGKGLLYKMKNKLQPQSVDQQQWKKNEAESIKKIKDGNFDIFHPTYYDHYFLDYIGDKPYVLTVYDLIHQIFPEYSLRAPVDKSKNLLNRASKIIAISESTKQDLITIFGIEDSKVSVCYLGNSMDVNDTDDNLQMELPKQYLLFVGSRETYKNFLFFVQAFAIISETEKDLCIVCTGANFSEDEIYYFNKLGIKSKIFHLYVNDKKLAYLYQHAEAFVFPSLYEGFGLPVLEAFACGCPVVISNTSSLPEVGGNAVIKFEPKNIFSLVEALTSILSSNEIKQSLKERGFVQLQQFSWAKMANETKNIYMQALANNRN